MWSRMGKTNQGRSSRYFSSKIKHDKREELIWKYKPSRHETQCIQVTWAMCCECTMLHKDAVSGLNASQRHQITESAAARVSLSHSSLFTENVQMMTKPLWPTESDWAHYSCAPPIPSEALANVDALKRKCVLTQFTWNFCDICDMFFFLLLFIFRDKFK